jgi:hypothetical protein
MSRIRRFYHLIIPCAELGDGCISPSWIFNTRNGKQRSRDLWGHDSVGGGGTLSDPVGPSETVFQTKLNLTGTL